MTPVEAMAAALRVTGERSDSGLDVAHEPPCDFWQGYEVGRKRERSALDDKAAVMEGWAAPPQLKPAGRWLSLPVTP